MTIAPWKRIDLAWSSIRHTVDGEVERRFYVVTHAWRCPAVQPMNCLSGRITEELCICQPEITLNTSAGLYGVNLDGSISKRSLM